MELIRLGEPGHERPAVRHEGTTFDLSGLTTDLTGDFIADGGLDRVRAALSAGTLSTIDESGQRIGAPVTRPGAVICIGQNYAAHAAESGGTPPEYPIIFFKHPNTIVGPNDDVLIPPGATKVDWEVELTVVIGKTARYLSSPEQALDHVAGYTIGNDVSERAWQSEISGGQWSKGKSAETFNPLGPVLVPAADLRDPQKLGIRSWVNGEPRQNSSTADMIFPVARLIHELSQHLVLEPGDVVNTGTPEGVALSGRFPFLKAGDVMELEIDGLGRQRSVLRAADG
ncbi:fumarylacetoacetate hydrolase family protein [Amycolatopsis pigmentata]|uniref:Fumarylacetoacetate hydrolase family protein n=1 Tax=Amycolatopsis pigmentata TaxID=450801 RepID=A0ABW5FRV3_9PSEU